jgi:predicted ATPase
MIWNKLYLEYFKCFEKLSLPLANLTLLSGVNASGKSTILQALVLLHQSVIDNELGNSLNLNGSIISLGTAYDVIDKSNGDKRTTIGIETDKYKCSWHMFSENPLTAYVVPIQEVIWRDFARNKTEVCSVNEQKLLHSLLPNEFYNQFGPETSVITNKISKLTYIAAERLGPRETYPVSIPNKQHTVGTHGEYTPWYLFANRDKKVYKLLQKTKDSRLPRQVETYLDFFFPGAGFTIEPVRNTNLVTLNIRTIKNGDYHRPQNVGYGLTHILPILTACLGANADDMILIENPEAHLHPAAQAQIGLFLAQVAATGVQIILETHSDHVLNGVRRAVKAKKLIPEQVAIYFFRQREQLRKQPQVQGLLIDAEGNLDDWPTDFFDQFDKDSAHFAGWE